ncbi:MAG: beta-galactosidase, partial [Clostridia bacterium]
MLELHRDITITNINRCKHRNYYVPKSISDDFSVFLNGSRVVSLNGEWNFAFYGDISEYEEQNFKGQVVKVPTNWQYYGVDYTQYINTRYQFECKPPILPDKIPCGVYKKVVNINKKDKEYYLNFEGVDSCLYLFVNGEFVGFSEGSHNQSEFLISKYLIDGDNQISVVVFKWCVGSYLECQDKIRLSGIFRNVYILERESQHIDSYKVNYVLSGRRAEVTLEIDDKYNLKKEITVARNGETIFYTKAQSNCITFHIDKVERWNSETPNIYSLQIVANS